MMHLILLPTALATLGTGTPANAPRQGLSLDTTVAVTAAKRLALDLRTGGSVRITGGGTSVVRIRVYDGGQLCEDCTVELEQRAEGIQLRSERPALGAAKANLRFEIDVPSHFDLDVASSGGELQIEGVDGKIRGQTQGGALTLLRLSGEVDLRTTRGDVVLRQSFVNGRVHTDGGRVLLEDVSGAVSGSSQNGKVTQRRVTRPDTTS